MALSTVAATAIPDVPNLPFLRDSVLRFVMTIGIGGLPFAFLGAGLSVPGLLQAALIQVMLLFDPDASTAQTIRARCLACSRYVCCRCDARSARSSGNAWSSMKQGTCWLLTAWDSLWLPTPPTTPS